MASGDSIPPHIYNAHSLRNAKYEYSQGLHVDKDPITALCLLKSSSMKNCIHSISLYPFHVYYCSVQQLQIFQAYCRANQNDAKINIDATGSLVRKIVRPDGSISGHIFLYQVVIYWMNTQISVYQMLSEKHDALSIESWLRYWVNTLGAPRPNEVVSDDGKALLIAAINSYTRQRTIREYVNASFKQEQIPCYIRIDVAHFLHKYAILLKMTQPLVKKFFMIAMGQLVLARSDRAAGQLIRSILIVCQSTSSGLTNEEQKTECSICVESIKDMVIQSRREDSGREINEVIEGKITF